MRQNASSDHLAFLNYFRPLKGIIVKTNPILTVRILLEHECPLFFLWRVERTKYGSRCISWQETIFARARLRVPFALRKLQETIRILNSRNSSVVDVLVAGNFREGNFLECRAA